MFGNAPPLKIVKCYFLSSTETVFYVTIRLSVVQTLYLKTGPHLLLSAIKNIHVGQFLVLYSTELVQSVTPTIFEGFALNFIHIVGKLRKYTCGFLKRLSIW